MPSAPTWAEGHYDSIRGRIGCRWERNAKGLTLSVRIPANMSATVYLPALAEKQVSEGGRQLRRAPGVKVLGVQDGCLRVAVGSGDYAFRIKRSKRP